MASGGSAELPDYGFIILRHVNSELTNRYWQRAYRRIRLFHDEPIIIIDDNSKKEFLYSDIELVNCQIIESEYPARAELLPYYYFHKLKPFKRVVVIHDSVFLNRALIPHRRYEAEILWSFENVLVDSMVRAKKDIPLIRGLNHSSALERYYLSNEWTPCFGVMTIITWGLVDRIDKKYNFFHHMLTVITDRNRRMCLERIFGCLISLESVSHRARFGHITDYCHYGQTWDDYEAIHKGKITVRQLRYSFQGYMPLGFLFYNPDPLDRLPLVKIWTGR